MQIRYFNGNLINDELIRKKGWRRADISGEDQTDLELRNVTLAHRGAYMCSIVGRKDEKCHTKTADLEVRGGVV